MIAPITVRFCETERYDPLLDAEVVCLMAVTNIGTWHTEVQLGRASQLRSKRDTFKNHVMKAIASGDQPQEIALG